MSTVRRLTLLSLGAAAAGAVAHALDTGDTGDIAPARGSITLVDPLDEAADGEFFCTDIFRSPIFDGDVMQVHTCNPSPRPSEDQDFTIDSPNSGKVYVTQADLCVAAERLRAGSHLQVVACSWRDERQQWDSKGDGQIHPASDATLCWAVDPVDYGRCGNPTCTDYKRALTLLPCADYDPKFLTWNIPGGAIGL